MAIVLVSLISSSPSSHSPPKGSLALSTALSISVPVSLPDLVYEAASASNNAYNSARSPGAGVLGRHPDDGRVESPWKSKGSIGESVNLSSGGPARAAAAIDRRDRRPAEVVVVMVVVASGRSESQPDACASMLRGVHRRWMMSTSFSSSGTNTLSRLGDHPGDEPAHARWAMTALPGASGSERSGHDSWRSASGSC